MVMRVKSSARMVLFDRAGKVAIINVGESEYYKIPGGSVEEGESLTEAVLREVREESGCEAEVTGELGRVETDIFGWGFHDVSEGFMGKVVGEKGMPDYDDYERERGFSVEWHDLDEAIGMIEKNIVEDRDKKSLQSRDLEFLKRAREF